MSPEIRLDSVVSDQKTLLAKNLCYGPHLGAADLHKQRPSWVKKPRRAVRDPPIGIEPVRTAIERGPRIVPGYLRREPIDLGACDIGRIGDDDIVAAGQPLEPIGGHEPRSIRNAQGQRVVLGNTQGAGTTINADPRRLRQFSKKRDEDAP